MEPKTHRSRRPVALSPDAIRVLRVHRAEQNARRLGLGGTWKDSDIVFASNVGTYWRPRNMARTFVGVVKRAKLSDVTFHTLRHTCASLMAKQGVPVTSISAQLGHANASITQSIYSHVLPGMQQEAARQVAAALKL